MTTFNPATPLGGELTIDGIDVDGALSRLRTTAPIAKVEIFTEPHYKDEGREVDFGPGHLWRPPEMDYLDLTVTVRLAAGTTEDGVLYAVYRPSAIMAELRLEHDDLKSLRETLCVAQKAIQFEYHGGGEDPDVQRIGRLIAEIDRQRPLGSDGKHGDLHTPTCGCER